jgi:hypothetical protein
VLVRGEREVLLRVLEHAGRGRAGDGRRPVAEQPGHCDVADCGLEVENSARVEGPVPARRSAGRRSGNALRLCGSPRLSLELGLELPFPHA